jgi:transposase
MVRRSLHVRNIAEILVHWQAERPLRQIARGLGVDRNTIRKYVGLAESLGFRPGGTHLSMQEWAAILKEHASELAGAPQESEVQVEIARFHEAIASGLLTNTVTTVWQRLHDEQGMQASARTFHRYVQEHFPDRVARMAPTVRRDDPPPGQEAQIDFASLGLWFDPELGKLRKLWVFSLVLSFSRHMFIYVVTRLDQQAWIRAHVAAFAFLGGAPRILVIDNLTPGVRKSDLYDPLINRGYAELASHYGVVIDPCRVVHPKDKPRVERPMSYIRDSFFAGRTFASIEEMNQCALKWCLSVAGERIHGTTRQRPLDLFLRQEASALLPLPAQPFEAVTWTQAKIARDCHAQVERVLYSIPFRYVGKTLAVRVSTSTVEFYLDQDLVKTHVRPSDGRRQTDWNDYPPHKAKFFQRNPDWCRAQARLLGPAVAEVVEGLLSQHALHFLRQCQGIISLADRYGPQRINSACQVSILCGDPSYRTVRNLLAKALEGQNPLLVAAPDGRAQVAGAYLHGPQQLFAAEPLPYPKEDAHG